MTAALSSASPPPPSGFAQAGGYLWLPRMLDKVRRLSHGPLQDYYALEDSPVDLGALMLLGVGPETIRGWVAEGLDDEAIASRLADARGHKDAEKRSFNRRFKLMWYPVLLVLEADEGRIRGLQALALRSLLPVLSLARRVIVAMAPRR